ncbi:hypothetical protein [Deinococcus aestuarii]|uniref:hypothetical protein n=1 Tax=Deinococcus aestuarii TaxID=2774531 RepID=UPI001C0C8659|nr:hypothetical protein [Deinococcus aestuarii]
MSAPTTPKIVVAEEGDVVLRRRTHTALQQLHADGAWRADEVAAHLPEAADLYGAGLLDRASTVIGTLTLLTPRGQRLIGSTARQAGSVSRQLDRAYTRLALKELGWSVTPDVQYLRQYDRTGRMTAVMTPFAGEGDSGAALVIGKMPGGFSNTGIRHLITRLRSNALRRGFWVILLSPSARRGQQLAATHPAWLKVIHVVPRLPQASSQDDLTVPIFAFKGPGDDPVIVPETEQLTLERLAARGHYYGPLWVSVLSRPRAARVAAFRQALAVDRVISGHQLFRLYGLEPSDVHDVHHVDTQLKPVHSDAAQVVHARFYVSDRRLIQRDVTFLSHAAGVAEMRVLLNVPPDPSRWLTGVALGRREFCKPDAVLVTEFGRTAVEYDTGSYTRSVIADKLGAFRDQSYEDVIWGVPGEARRERLAQEWDLRVLLTRWF